MAAVLLAVATNALPARAGSVRPFGSVTGEVVVQLASTADLSAIEKEYQLRPVDKVTDVPTYKLAIMDGSSVSRDLSLLQRDPDIRAAEPDYLYRAPEAAGALYADPKYIGAHPWYFEQLYLEQWALPLMGFDAAHAVTNGAGVTIAVIDTGVETDHPDLAGHLVDGYDELNDTATVADPVGGPDSGHGTFVAGLIALAAPDARIMPIRALDPQGQGDEVDVASAIYYAVDHGANIVNLSLGSYQDSATMDAAVAYAEQHGVVVVAAAGNDNTARPQYPAATSGVVAVAATDRSDLKATFSNYGRYITVSAPGTELYSAYDDGGYAFGDGTSFAAPLVSAVAGLVWAAHPELDSSGVVRSLVVGSTNIDALNPDYAGLLGAGRVDAKDAVSPTGSFEYSTPVPSPTQSAATPTDGTPTPVASADSPESGVPTPQPTDANPTPTVDTPEPTPTPTDATTPVPTDTATPVPTDTATLEPTAVDTPTPAAGP